MEDARYTLNLEHPEILRAILAGIIGTGDVVGRDGSGRTLLTVAVDDWLLDALAGIDADREDREMGEMLEA